MVHVQDRLRAWKRISLRKQWKTPPMQTLWSLWMRWRLPGTMDWPRFPWTKPSTVTWRFTKRIYAPTFATTRNNSLHPLEDRLIPLIFFKGGKEVKIKISRDTKTRVPKKERVPPPKAQRQKNSAVTNKRGRKYLWVGFEYPTTILTIHTLTPTPHISRISLTPSSNRQHHIMNMHFQTP